MSDDNGLPDNSGANDKTPLQIAPGTIRIELVQSSKWSVALLALLLVCGLLVCIAWVAIERTTARILSPESKLSVLDIEQSDVDFHGIDGQFDISKVQYSDKSTVGIAFTGFARLGIDLSKAKFDVGLSVDGQQVRSLHSRQLLLRGLGFVRLGGPGVNDLPLSRVEH